MRSVLRVAACALATFVCGGPDMAPAPCPAPRTATELSTFVCGGPDMAPALPHWQLVGVAAAAGGRAVSEDQVQAVAARLRCVVCQNLSVSDSPSEMASEMRGIIRERLAAGEQPDQIVQYFVDKYGEWILLSPRGHGFNLLVWAAPAVAVLAGLLAVGARLRRWTRPQPAAPSAPLDPALRERIRRELESEP